LAGGLGDRPVALFGGFLNTVLFITVAPHCSNVDEHTDQSIVTGGNALFCAC